jgi:hypothetical protein
VCPKLRPRQLTEFLTKLVQKKITEEEEEEEHTLTVGMGLPPGVVIYLCGPFCLPQLYTRKRQKRKKKEFFFFFFL